MFQKVKSLLQELKLIDEKRLMSEDVSFQGVLGPSVDFDDFCFSNLVSEVFTPRVDQKKTYLDTFLENSDLFLETNTNGFTK